MFIQAVHLARRRSVGVAGQTGQDFPCAGSDPARVSAGALTRAVRARPRVRCEELPRPRGLRLVELLLPGIGRPHWPRSRWPASRLPGWPTDCCRAGGYRGSRRPVPEKDSEGEGHEAGEGGQDQEAVGGEVVLLLGRFHPRVAFGPELLILVMLLRGPGSRR